MVIELGGLCEKVQYHIPETAQKECDKHNSLRIVSVRIGTGDIPNTKQ
jgi:hypothetical protein